MNNQITRRNLLKLLGVSGVTLPLTGISKDIDINPKKSLQNDGTIKLSSNENPYGPSPKVRDVPSSFVIGPPSAAVPSCVCPELAAKAANN